MLYVVLLNFTEHIVSNTTNNLKLIPFLQMIIKKHCMAREQATSDFFSLKDQICTYT